jgi:pyruvate/2-oxoglutarate/acetoin dehydrogenase E1 component/TPP-dependent pyruvate/acetoin dehydrogenase alpha subunit
MASKTAAKPAFATLGLTAHDVLQDYRLAVRSREASLLGRKEVLTGKAKFGIFGDGKELPQIAAARAARPGDVRSGYYRDQTFMMACGLTDVRKFFAQLYAHTSLEHEPATAGRQMNGHYATRWLDDHGNYLDLTQTVHSSADASPTAGQMPRMLGLAQASKLYRNQPELHTPEFQKFSKGGNEIVFGTIGDASTSEGLFWETMNAAGVLQVPLLMSVWDDNYGISVNIEHQTIKRSISTALAGFDTADGLPGVRLFKVRGWDYIALVSTYQEAADYVRTTHAPALVHVYEVTQPQGHSTSGSHERYKSKERLQWEKDFDCVARLRAYILETGLATEDELTALEAEEKKHVQAEKKAAWDAFLADIKSEVTAAAQLLEALEPAAPEVAPLRADLLALKEPIRKDIHVAIRRALVATRNQPAHPARQALIQWRNHHRAQAHDWFSSHLLSEGSTSPLRVPEVKPTYDATTPADVPGFEILQKSFALFFERHPNLVAFGEDVGFLGDVNQGMAGLQERFGQARVSDTGIREATIVGQGIGLAMRGLRPIAEIQYLDYIFYALQLLSDDLATLRWRTKGGQKAPAIIRTRGHRLEGIWHSGSPMQALLGMLRGVHVLVPRDMTRAAGFYNTLLQGDDPAVVVEVLNGYRHREPLPTNLGHYTVPLGVPETLRTGAHITLVTYGACCRIALEAADVLATLGVELEVIDAQSLLPFDIHGHIGHSLRRTNRLVVLDEDFPGGASAYILQQVLEGQDGYRWLDSKPLTITAQPHRPAYATDGDYFSKPNAETVIEACYALMREADPARYPELF